MRHIALVAAFLIAGFVVAPAAHAATTYTVLFDDTKAETAGNADWIVSTSMPDPLAQNPAPTTETSWTGALSAWGVALQRTGRYAVKTLPPSGAITYGNSSNALDLSHVNAFVLPEPNVLFTAAEKTAILQFVQNGGGLFMISDHNGSDRNNDGSDSVAVLNGLMSGNPFGFSIDKLDISNENPSGIGTSARIVNGPFGTATGSIIRDGTTATLNSSAAHGEIYRAGYSTSGTTGAAFATSTYGSGRVAFWGDSSPMDDGTGQSGNTLYNGWDDPAGTDATLALNATEWLASGTVSGGGGGGTERVTNGGFESGSSPWTLGGAAAVTTARAHAGTHAVALCGANNCADSISQSVALPAGTSPQLSFDTYVTTQETGTTAYDKLTVQVNGTTVATLSNASSTNAWFATTANLSAYAGQTITVRFAATGGTKLPTSFWVDDVSVLA
ncbi:MAG TPA: hypothetical protein VGL21_04830 [Jatrophihabitantaceae bacterium]